MKLKIYIILLFTLAVSYSAYAQVGIGNLSPDSTSILDLTNSQNRGLKIPATISVAAMSNSNRSIYFFDNNIYFKTSLGYNAISPWKYKFNGNTTNNIYFNLNGNIGIGNTNLTTAPEAPLQIETDSAVDLSSNGSLLLGKSSAKNMVINSHEIQTRDAGASSELKINEDGGDVTFGDSAAPVDVFVTGKVQELDDATNTYYDLIPVGIITAWFGYTTNIPKGWAVCDGGTYANTNGIGNTIVPNLSGRFIVSVGNNGSNTYTAHDTGGEDLVSLTINEIPSHSHNTRTTGAHSHGFTYEMVTSKYPAILGSRTVVDEEDETSFYYANTATGYANITQGTGGTGQAHENRPVYYSLVYIIKL